MAENTSAPGSHVRDDLNTGVKGNLKTEGQGDYTAEVDNDLSGSPIEGSKEPLNTITVIKSSDSGGVQVQVNGRESVDDLEDKDTVLIEKTEVTLKETKVATSVSEGKELNGIKLEARKTNQYVEQNREAESAIKGLKNGEREASPCNKDEIEPRNDNMAESDRKSEEPVPHKKVETLVKRIESTVDRKDDSSNKGASSGADALAKSAGDDVDEFRGMTEEEIQAIIRKYSFMDPEVRRRSLHFFWSMDVERWGYFNFSQLLYLYRAQGSNLTDKQICSIFADLDKDRDSLVSLDEFLLEMSKNRPRHYTKQELKDMFQRYDKNQDGYVCADDIHATMKEAYPDYKPSFEVEYDALKFDHTGEYKRLDFLDFSKYMRKVMDDLMSLPQC